MQNKRAISKKVQLIDAIVIFISILIFSRLFVCIYNSNQVKSFSIHEYEEEITDFSSEKIFGYTRKMGEIANSHVAKEYAQEIWIEVYGENVKDKKPYKVYWDNENNVWLVTGTLKKHWLSGVPHIIFSKNDGEIIAVWHTR